MNKFDMTLPVTQTAIPISIWVNGDKGMINCAGLHFSFSSIHGPLYKQGQRVSGLHREMSENPFGRK